MLQRYEFEGLLMYMEKKLAEFKPSQLIDRLNPVGLLCKQSVTTIHRSADAISLARI